MKFRVDKHRQLRITDVQDIEIDPTAPDTLIVTQEDTVYLLMLLITELVQDHESLLIRLV